MKTGRWLLVAALAGAALAAARPGWAAGETPRARVATVVGTVRVQRGGEGGWTQVTATTDHNLYAGDRVQTSQRSRATIVVGGARVLLGPRTEVVVPGQRAPQRRPSLLEVVRGHILSWLIGTRELEIGTGGAVATASGTRFALEVDDQGVTTLTVLEGEVSFHNDLGQVVVKQGEQSAATTATAPTRPHAVDVSGYLEWEASLDSVWLGFERRHQPAETRDRLKQLREEARKQAEGAPRDPAAQRRAGDLCHDLGDLDAAEAYYRRALDGAPEDPAAHASLGYTLLAAGRSAEAQAEFEAAGKSASAGAEPLIGQAVAALAAGTEQGRARAEAQLKQALAREPNNAPAHTVAGLLAVRRGDAAAARAALQRALELDPRMYLADAYLSAVQLAAGDAGAVKTAQQAVALAPASGLAHESLGTAYFLTGAADQARREADLALEASPDSPGAHLLLADLLAAQGDLDGALREAQTSVTLDPLLAPGYNALGMISLAQNALGQAERAFAKALALSPNLVAARTGMGVTYARQGKLAQALEMQTAAIALDSGLASTHNNLGAVLLAKGRLKEAAAEFEEALRRQPDWSLARGNLALAYLEQNRFADAVREGEEAVRRGGDSARVHTTLARVYLKQNRTNKAWAALRRALELDETYALGHFELAEVLLRQGRSRDAVREQLQALTLQPAAASESREYARTEATVSGHEGGLFGRIKTDGRADHGQTSYFATAERESNDMNRGHTHWDRTTTLGILGRQTSADHTQVFYVSTQDERRELSGRALAGGAPKDPDDTSVFRGMEAQYLTRFPASRDGRITLKLGYRTSWQESRNPDSLAPLGDANPFRRVQLRYEGPLLETRLDQRLSSRHQLVAGVAVAGEKRNVAGVLGTPNPPPAPPTWTPFASEAQRNGVTGYLEEEQRLGPHTRLMLGGRAVLTHGSTPVFRPKASFRQSLGRSGTVVLLTRPLARDDVSELSPVDRWALRDAASPLDFALGGFSQSYEAQYQLIPRNGSLLRVSVFHRSLRNLLVDLQDPQLAPLQAPVVVAAGTLRGAEVELEHWLTRELSAGAWVRVSENSRTGTGGLDIPFQPRLNSEVRLDYLNRSGVRVALVWSHVGSRYANLANTWKRSGFEVVNLSLARQFSLHTDVVLVVDDLLNEGNGFWPRYPGRGRTIRGGVQYRF